MPSLRSLLACAALFSALLFASGASAQTEAQKQKAKEHFEKASRLYDVGRYAEAIEEYQKAYLNVEDPVFLYNIGQCYRLSDRPSEAIRFYRNYLRRAPSAPNRADVEKRIAEMEKLLEERGGGAATTPPPAGTTPPPTGTTPPPPTGTTPPPPTGTTPPPTGVAPPPTPGPTGSGAPSTGIGPTSTPPPFEAGPVTAPGVDLTKSTEPPPSSFKRKLALGLMVGGGAGLVIAAIAGAVAADKAKKVEESPVFLPDEENAGRAANGVAVGFGLLGAAAAITGGVLLLTDRPAQPEATAVLPPKSPRPVARVTPLFGPGLAGAGARFTF